VLVGAEKEKNLLASMLVLMLDCIGVSAEPDSNSIES